MSGGRSPRRQRLTQEATSATRFALIGILATGTHAGTALLSLKLLGFGPYLSNIAGFTVAFAVSFCGHHLWSFAHTRAAAGTAGRLLRFFAIALAGFALNSGVLTGWLKLTNWPESLGLLVAIGVVPVLSFLFARFWAFRAVPASLSPKD